MSRRAFRAQVAAPRPVAAWLLVAVASATLWTTGQLSPWAMALEASLLALGFWRRTAPFAWQGRSAVLNAALVAIVVAALAVHDAGSPATIPLAHFAALTQPLQLLDARPRRSEFLLVVLALFQVILASNLTDSAAFPPLLAVFVFCAAWTLLLHTLHSEAIEAGEEAALARAVTPGLLRTTLVASGCAVLLAGIFFVMLPRLRTTVISGTGLSGGFAMAGFSDRVSLGDLGRIRQDPSVVLRVETLSGRAPDPVEAYWRGLAFDRFDGRTWSVSAGHRELVPGSPEGGVGFGRAPERRNLEQRIVREPVAAGVVFTAGEPRALHGTLRQLERDGNGGLVAPQQAADRIRYEVATWQRRPSERELRGDTAQLPPGAQRYLQLPPLRREIQELAARITAGAAGDAGRALAIEQYLRLHGRYSDTPPPLPEDRDTSPVEAFLLGDATGHCEYFASAMVILARSLGIPARLVNGFAGGRRNEIGDFVELSQSDAHAWVEIHFARHGWVRYDPTPPDLRLRVAAEPSAAERLRDLASAAELWWYQRVVGFDRADQIQALKQAWLAWQGLHAPDPSPPRRTLPGGGPSLPGPRTAALLASGLLAGLLWWRRRRSPASALPRAYGRALRMLARRGLVRGPATPARDFARRVAEARPELRESFGALTESYLRERFGHAAGDPAQTQLAAFRRALHGGARPRQSAP